MTSIADYLIIELEKAKLEAQSKEKLRALCEKFGVDYDAITGGPRPGEIAQDPFLSEVYDLQEMNAILDSLLAKEEGGEEAVGALEDIEGVTPEVAQQFRDLGLQTPEDVAEAAPSRLERARGVGKTKARQIKEAARGTQTAQV